MTYYAPGKIMISGEYVVLDGAKALAIPTSNYGQSLKILPNNKYFLWQSYDPNGLWFEATFTDKLHVVKTTNQLQATLLQKILTYIKNEKPILFINPIKFETELSFNKNWGFGSSATLIALLSKWSSVNPYKLLDISFGGSGYDLAVALEAKPVLYQLAEAETNKPNYRNKQPKWQVVEFKPDFSDSLFLVYLNKKQNSREEIKKYKTRKAGLFEIQEISQISEALLETRKLSDFENLIIEHEDIISRILQRPTVKQRLFPDYPGSIKSLGAWGGDFVLATGKQAPVYFKNKGFQTLINFNEIRPVNGH